jgi:hypothetical protein
VDVTARYLELHRLGRDAFMRDAAAAALVRAQADPMRGRPSHDPDETVVADEYVRFRADPGEQGHGFDVCPLQKKQGAPFSHMITVGRTANNDVVLDDVTVSRFQAYFRCDHAGWWICDAGSKNGSMLNDARLDARKELAIRSGSRVRFGDVEATFYVAPDLYAFMTSRGG